MKITKEQFDSLFDENIKKKDYDHIISLIDQRFGEICEKFLVKKNKHGSWYDYDNASYEDEDSRGSFDPVDYKNDVGIMGEWIEPPPGYDLSFPSRWLWEDFEEELKQEIENYKKLELLKKETAKKKKEEKKEERNRLHAQIKQKLTPEELKTIKFVL